MKECPFCKEKLAENANFCLYCMHSLIDKEVIGSRCAKRSRRPLITLCLLGVILLLFGSAFLFEREQAKSEPKPTKAHVEKVEAPVSPPKETLPSPQTFDAQSALTQTTTPTDETETDYEKEFGEVTEEPDVFIPPNYQQSIFDNEKYPVVPQIETPTVGSTPQTSVKVPSNGIVSGAGGSKPGSVTTNTPPANGETTPESGNGNEPDEPEIPTEPEEPPFSWYVSGTVLTVSGSGEIPDYPIGGAPWHHACNGIKRIVISEGITKIGANAFYGFSEAESVSLPLSLHDVSYGAFLNCGNLSQVYYAGSNSDRGSIRNASTTLSDASWNYQWLMGELPMGGLGAL